MLLRVILVCSHAKLAVLTQFANDTALRNSSCIALKQVREHTLSIHRVSRRAVTAN